MPTSASTVTTEDDPLWYQNAVIYQTHVRAFSDSDGDGIGDFRGLTGKLDYLVDLGVTAVWLLPFYPSPLRDDGYDTADYTDVHPAYGTLRDVRQFIREAHRRGLRVITELVLNHTSDQHPWFQRARRAKPGTSHRDFYVWSDTDEKYADTRIIFKDFEASNWTWDPVAQAFYWHRFYSHQPDLNFDHPPVHRALLKVVDFWLNMGVDGLRLDAVPYLYEREGTTCENLPETHEFLKMLRRHVDRKFRNRMLLAEANQWPEDAISYFGDPKSGGDECHMAFHFPLMPRLFMATRMEDRFPIIDILQQTPEIPANCQWAVFLRNHDELTLEMVTDEERDYMYRVYANDRQARINLGIRRRLAPLLTNSRRKIELMNGLLFSMPGTPVIYYGDEIGMGDNVFLGDRNGVRTPMQWSSDRNAGFSRANPQQLYLPVITDPEYHFETVNVEAQFNNSSSLFWWIRRLIALRQRYPVFGSGRTEFLHPDNPKVLAFIRRTEEQQVLVVANLSRFVQCVELDLAEFRDRVPVELFGFTRFPPIGELPYFLTLGPHAFYWFELQDERSEELADTERNLPTITTSGGWENLFKGRGKASLERSLPRTLVTRRWFGGKAQGIESVSITDAVPMSYGQEGQRAMIILLDVSYVDAEPETYQLPLAMVTGNWVEDLLHDAPHAVYARIRQKGSDEPAALVDAVYVPDFCRSLLDGISRRRRFKGRQGEVHGRTTSAYRRLKPAADVNIEPTVSRAEQSNSSVIYGEQFIFKFFRRIGEGMNPDLEIGRFLTEKQQFEHTAPVTGYLEYQAGRADPRTLGMLQQFLVNEGDAWRSTLSALSPFFERVQTDEEFDVPPPLEPSMTLARRDTADPPDTAVDLIGPYLQSAELLGRRTAEMHLALAADHEDPAFRPESFTPHQQRSIYQSMRNLTRQAIRMLRRRIKTLPESVAEDARRAVDGESVLLDRLVRIKDQPLGGQRIRTHGDYHLGQVLSTGRDFIIIDFEGEPARPLTERKMKRSPLRDVAGMLRSFDYAAHTVLHEHMQRFGVASAEMQQRLGAWAGYWRAWVEAVFLRSYLDTAGPTPILPSDDPTFDRMLHMYLLEKTVYELQYELNNRPTWVSVPLTGVLELIDSEEKSA